MEFDKSSQQCAMHAATGRVRASLPPPPILVCAIVKIKSTRHFGLVLRQRPKWKTPLLQGGSHTTDNIECWTDYVYVQNNDALSEQSRPRAAARSRA